MGYFPSPRRTGASTRGALTSNLFLPFTRDVPVLELIFSCVESSQELFYALGSQHAVRPSDGRATQDFGNGGEGDVTRVLEEESYPEKRGTREGY